MKYFVEQTAVFGMGNFINCTPTIQTLYEHFKAPVPVFFRTPLVAELFSNWKKIQRIHQPTGNRLFGSNMVNREIPDFEYVHQRISKKLELGAIPVPHTYVDAHPPPAPYKAGEYVVIVRGGIPGGWWEEKKEVGDPIYKYIMDRIDLPKVIIGTSADYNRSLKRMEKWPNVKLVLNDIKASLGLLNGAAYVIANDTGMYHAAGALKKDVFVIWKDTPFIKNKSPHAGCFYSQKDMWEQDFDQWIVQR